MWYEGSRTHLEGLGAKAPRRCLGGNDARRDVLVLFPIIFQITVFYFCLIWGIIWAPLFERVGIIRPYLFE